MKKYFFILCLLINSILIIACTISETNESEETNQEKMPTDDLIQETRDIDISNPSMMIDLNITIDDQIFVAKLYDNQTSDINMSDHNSNEKFL